MDREPLLTLVDQGQRFCEAADRHLSIAWGGAGRPGDNEGPLRSEAFGEAALIIRTAATVFNVLHAQLSAGEPEPMAVQQASQTLTFMSWTLRNVFAGVLEVLVE